MKRWFGGARKYPLIVSFVTILLFLGGWALLSEQYLPVLSPSGQIADEQRDLIVFTVVLSAVVVVPVFTLLAVFAWKYRDTNKSAKYDPEWANNTKLEVAWWGIPIAIIILLSVVTWITSHSLDPYRPIESSNETIEVQVVALQWKWLFIYPEYGVATVNDLTMPVGTPVHFSLSADAPMSAFWIPALGSQIYSMNAMTSQLYLIADEPGTFKGYNTNINGDGYASMKFDVNAVSDAEFRGWLKHHSASSDVLDAARLAEISEPNVPDGPIYFQLKDPKIFDSIIAKYMSEGSHGTMESMKTLGGDSNEMHEEAH